MKAGRAARGIPQVPCMACGARDVEVTRPGWAEGVRDWLGSGGPWRPPRWVCRRCGKVSGARSVATLRPSRPPTWWRRWSGRRSASAPSLCSAGPGARPPPAGRAVPGRPIPPARPAALLAGAAPPRRLGRELVQEATAGHHRAQLGSWRPAGRPGAAAPGRGQRRARRRGSGDAHTVRESPQPGRGPVAAGRAHRRRRRRALGPDRRRPKPARPGLVAGHDPGGWPAGRLRVACRGPPLGRPGRAG
jgi:hypothetical protein